jgi:hypothetical protein
MWEACLEGFDTRHGGDALDLNLSKLNGLSGLAMVITSSAAITDANATMRLRLHAELFDSLNRLRRDHQPRCPPVARLGVRLRRIDHPW